MDKGGRAARGSGCVHVHTKAKPKEKVGSGAGPAFRWANCGLPACVDAGDVVTACGVVVCRHRGLGLIRSHHDSESKGAGVFRRSYPGNLSGLGWVKNGSAGLHRTTGQPVQPKALRKHQLPALLPVVSLRANETRDNAHFTDSLGWLLGQRFGLQLGMAPWTSIARSVSPVVAISDGRG
jgi:hypothetical protein